MDPRAAALIKIADDIAEMHLRLAGAAGTHIEAKLRLSVWRLERALDNLIDASESVIEIMPWWAAWLRGAPPQ
jgi:hypothetical protein